MSEVDALDRPFAPPRETSDGIWQVVKNVRKYWAIVLATAMLATGAALAYVRAATKVYQASTMLEIDPHPNQPLKDNADVDMGVHDFWDTQDYYATQYKIIVSDMVLRKVVTDLGLALDPAFLRSGRVHAPASVEAAIGLLRKRVTVEPVKSSRLVWIHVDDPDPRRAVRVCDAVAKSYITQNLDTAVNASAEAVGWLGEQIDHLKGELDRDENALHDFKRKNDLPSTSINEASNMLRVEMQELDTALTQTRTKKVEIAARNAELSKLDPNNPDDLAASELLSSTYLQSLRRDYEEALRDRGALIAEGRGEHHPDVMAATQKAEQAKIALLAEIKNVQGAAARDLSIVTDQEQAEAALYEATRRRAVDLSMKEIEYHRLDRTRAENEKLYATLIERMKEADLARMMRVNNVRVVDPAVEPFKPIRPRLTVVLPLGALTGLLLGLGLALLRQRLDSSIKTPGDVEQRLGMTFLGLLPRCDEAQDARRPRRLRNRHKPEDGLATELVVYAQPSSGIAEASRSVRTNLMFMNPDKPYKSLLVTSSAPGEGKTTVACSIAIAFAQGGQRVCVIDCDLRRPRLHRIFDRAGDAGITNVLMGEATIEDVAKPTVVPNLWSIPAGALPPNPADLLNSDSFKRLIQELSGRFDRVIIDSPPVVAVTDSAIISTLVDGTVFVVRGFKTPKNLAAQGLQSLRAVDANLAGLVLNAVNLNSNEYNYYYHYYYYQREGYRPLAGARGDRGDEPALPPN